MYNKSKYISYLFLISFELILILVIIFLTSKIIALSKGSIKGAQYVSVLKKEDYITDIKSPLKNFYEPKANEVIIENPEWLGYEVKHKINSDTLHEVSDYQIVKNSTTFRILTIGDSWTYGVYVNDYENYPKVLEKKLNKLLCKNINKFEVINLGVGGYDIAYSVERFIKRGIKYNPDLVIWFINYWNFEKINDAGWQTRLDLQKSGLKDFDPKTKKWWISDLLNSELIKVYGKQFILDYQKNYMYKYTQYINLINTKLLLISLDHIRSDHVSIINDIVNTNLNYLYFTLKNKTVSKLLDGHPDALGYENIVLQLSDYLKENIFSNCNYK